MLLRRLGNEALHLHQHLFHREARREDVLGLAQLQALGQLGKFAREQVQARDITLRLGLALHLMHLHHELRQRALHAVQLVDREVVELVRLAVGLDLQEVRQHVVGQLAFTIEPIAIVALERSQVFLQLCAELALVRRRCVIELGAVEVGPAGQDAHRRQHLRAFDRKRGEHAGVEPVQVQRLEIDGVDEQRRHHQYQGQHRHQQPFRHSLHASLPCAVNAASRRRLRRACCR